MESPASPIRVRAAWLALLLAMLVSPAAAQPAPQPNRPIPGQEAINQLIRGTEQTPDTVETPAAPLQQIGLPDFSKRENVSAAMQLIVMLTVLSLAPAILVMMTSFTRIIIVLSLLRQALGTQQLPPNQIIIGLALFMTFMVMGPTWQRVNDEALQPYMNGDIDQVAALTLAQQPVRQFMLAQIEAGGNDEDIFLFHEFADPTAKDRQQITGDEVGTMTLIPAFVLSELKTAFLLGFKVYLPFLIIDMVISAILISMGMMMLPPVLISLPFKILLFVLVDGWRLIVGSLMGSFVM